jgi:dolichol-phosphate mannosyltransferase
MKVSSSKISIIIPSYNESNNIGLVIKGIRKEFPAVKIIVVDDSSPQENKKVVKVLSKFKDVKLISRGRKMGRGTAVIEGFRNGLKNKEAKYFFEIDSDLAHDTNNLIKFIERMEKEKSGMVIGSRYIDGGKIVNVSIQRRILSKIINRFLYMMLDVKLKDYTSGFRLYRRDAVEYLTNKKLKSTGFIMLSEITFWLNRKKFKISEVPATISSRLHGKSTMGLGELVNSLVFILKLKLEEDFLRKFFRH